MKVGVIDYGIGNVNSIINFLNRIKISATPINHPEDLEKCHALILPGVGAFDNATNHLIKTGFFDAIKDYSQNSFNKVIGICLGMQLLGLGSEEGKSKGLGLIDMCASRFDNKQVQDIEIPNIGWRETFFKVDKLALLNIQSVPAKFYHVHSFHVTGVDKNCIISNSFHGYEFVNGVNKGNIWGFQFHPEKSHFWGELLFYLLLKESV